MQGLVNAKHSTTLSGIMIFMDMYQIRDIIYILYIYT